MTLRPILENPIRSYAIFSGRASRAEFWLFVLTCIVVTQLAWLLGFGVMKGAGFDQGHDNAPPHHLMEKSEQDGARPDNRDKGWSGNKTNTDQASRTAQGSEDRTSNRQYSHHDDTLNFIIHRHGKDGYHLHGTFHDGPTFPYGHNDIANMEDHGRFAYRDVGRDKRHHMRFHDSRAERGGNILLAITSAALLLPLLAVGSRRLHDSNHSGWWQLLALIPIAG